MSIDVTAYRGAGNVTEFALKLGGTTQDLSAQTRFVLVADDGTTLDSDNSAEAAYFDWTTNSRRVLLELGAFTAITPGIHIVEVRSYNSAVDPYFTWGILRVNFI